jgi:hypothetical protein
VSNYWADDTAVGKLFQAAIDLTTEPAWDVYLVYEPGILWNDDGPPRPTYFMHQLGGRLPNDRRLDGEKLASAIRSVGDE